jgi:hypothetical protein
MPSLLDPDQTTPDAGAGLLGIGRPQIAPPDPGAVSQADALAQTYQAITAEIARQQQISADRGLWADGRPTAAGVTDAAQQYAQGLLFGTTEPGAPGGLSLEQVKLRRQWAQPNNHTFHIKDAEGWPVGMLDTEWDPMMGELHIADIQSHEGKNSFGPGAIKQLLGALQEHYPDARTISGYRISGASPNREIFQRLTPYQGRE